MYASCHDEPLRSIVTMAWQFRQRTSHFAISARMMLSARPLRTMLLTLAIFVPRT